MEPFAGLNPPYRTLVVDPPWKYDDGPLGWQKQVGKTHFLPYSWMGLDDIEALPVAQLGTLGSHLYLWTTQRYLWDASRIANSWGWRVQQVLTWCKPPMGMGLGGTYANTTEFVLFCRRPATEVGRFIQKAREEAGISRPELHQEIRGGKPTGIVHRWEAGDCYPTTDDWDRLCVVLGMYEDLAPDGVRHPTCWWEWARGVHSAKPRAFFDIVERVSPGPYVELFARSPRLGWDHWGYGYEAVA